MSQTPYGTWVPYSGSDGWILAGVLLLITGVLIFLGTRLRQPASVARPGRTVTLLLAVIWVLALLAWGDSVTTYGNALLQQAGPVTPVASPIAPITFLCDLVTFILIAVFARRRGFWVAAGSAVIGAIAAPLIFELPFDLIVMWRTYSPDPATQYTLLFFLPLFILELVSFTLLLASPLPRISRATLFSLAGMFFVFAVWAMFGFHFPSSPLPFTFNAVSKVLCFVATVTLFIPQGALPVVAAAASA